MRSLTEVLKEYPEFEKKLGWKRGEGDIIYFNPRLGEIIAVAVCDDSGKPLYDQLLHNEPVGAITVPVNTDGEIGLITQKRWIFPDGVEPQFPLLDVSILGAPSIEFPRGFPFKGEKPQETAERETEEEMDSPIISSKLLGYVRPNSTFHPHKIPAYLVSVKHDFKGTIPPDINEKILKVEWHDIELVKAMIKEKKITCGMTQAAFEEFLCQ